MATRGAGTTISTVIGTGYLRGIPDRLNAWAGTLTFHEKLLWMMALVLLFLDLVTTGFGLQIGLHESNPLANHLFERLGFWALGGLKGFSLGVAIGGWAILSDDHRYIVPICLSIPWSMATVWNTIVIVNTLAS